MIIFEADDPLVLNGTYDQEGYKPGERARIAKAEARAQKEAGDTMSKKKKPAPRATRSTMKASKPTSARKPQTVPVVRHRTNTIKGNGAPASSREVAPPTVTIGEAMRRAVAELGETVIDDNMAPAQMRQLAECYEQVAREQAAYGERCEQSKLAKKSLDSATALLLEKVRTFTHVTPLPLFDGQQREADQANMLDSVEAGE